MFAQNGSILFFYNLAAFFLIFALFLAGKNPFYYIWNYAITYIPAFAYFSPPEKFIIHLDIIFDKVYRITLLVLSLNFLSAIFNLTFKRPSLCSTQIFSSPVLNAHSFSKFIGNRSPIRVPVPNIMSNGTIKDPFDDRMKIIEKYTDFNSPLPILPSQSRPYRSGIFSPIDSALKTGDISLKSTTSKYQLLSFADYFNISEPFYNSAILNVKQALIAICNVILVVRKKDPSTFVS